MNRRLEIGIAGRILNRNSFDWIERLATGLGIQGTCFTRPDGSIRVSAEGEEAVLREFAEKIEKGYLFDRVENFFIKWEVAENKSFRILAGA